MIKNILSIFNNLPINRKLSTIVVLTSGLLIIIMIIAVSFEKHTSFRSKLVNSSTVLAEVIGANATASLVFKDPYTAHEMLAALQAEDDVITAGLYDGDGKLFVSYRHPLYDSRNLSDELPESIAGNSYNALPRFSSDYFDVIRRIVVADEIVGHIVLRTDLAQLSQQLQKFWMLILGLSSVLLIAATAICARLNRTITEPVSQLAQIMRIVTNTQEYGVRLKKNHDDEIGILIDGFNIMLDKIQTRDLELEKHRHNLEELIDIRTRELQIANEQVLNEIRERQDIQIKLAHAEKMEAIGRLAGGVAHDLNNILSGIVTYPDFLLLDLPEDSNLRAPIQTIRASGKRAAAIVQDLLTLARRGVKVEEQIDLQKVVIEYLESLELKELLETSPGVTVQFSTNDERFPIRGSSVHLGKTLMNLVANGVEAIKGDGVVEVKLSRITLDARPPGFDHWRAGSYICLMVTDNGVGIADKDHKRIFEPFYSRKVMGKSGTGLGMAVVWGTIEDHKGHITLKSKENEGTTFQLFFPAEESSSMHQVKEKIPVEIARGIGQSVLVVDDSEEQLLIASNILKHLGYRVTTLSSGEAAVQYLKSCTVDLVILDMLMASGIDGLETYKRILEFRPDQKAFIASGYSLPANVEEARTLGVSAYVMKPYTVRRLGEVLQQALAE